LHSCRLSAVRCDRPRPVFEPRVLVLLPSMSEGSNKGIKELVNVPLFLRMEIDKCLI